MINGLEDLIHWRDELNKMAKIKLWLNVDDKLLPFNLYGNKKPFILTFNRQNCSIYKNEINKRSSNLQSKLTKIIELDELRLKLDEFIIEYIRVEFPMLKNETMRFWDLPAEPNEFINDIII